MKIPRRKYETLGVKEVYKTRYLKESIEGDHQIGSGREFHRQIVNVEV